VVVVMPRQLDPVTKYAKEVTEGKQIAGELVRLACERHLNDLVHGKERGLFFDQKEAQFIIDFFGFLKHFKGRGFAGKPFILEDWQKFIVGSINGWKRADGTRRFREAYNQIARKNGKSPLGGGVGDFMTVADGEPGAEVYSAATKKDQARIVFNYGLKMMRPSPAFQGVVTFNKNNLCVEATESKFEPLSADENSLDGLQVHCAVIDELHAHKNRGVWDVLESALGARDQPLIFAITTAGFDQCGICYEIYEYCKAILKGREGFQDDSFFAYISQIDAADDWTDERNWYKANPNLGISVNLEYMRDMCRKALKLPSAQNNFLCKNLNKWVQQADRWIPLHLWDQNAQDESGNKLTVNEKALLGRECYGGLDLSSVDDLTAWVLVFPNSGTERVDILARIFCPEERVYSEQNRYRSQYQAWVRQGFLIATPGNAIDYGFVKQVIYEDAAKFKLIDFNIDRLFEGYQMTRDLQEEGLKAAPMGQGFLSMAVPMKEFERRLLKKCLNHGNNPVLRWMADCVATKPDAAGNLKIDKAKSFGKVDGIVALVMAIDRLIRNEKPVDVGEFASADFLKKLWGR
jgi:phage terminase large subunit-like protein